MTTFTPRDPAYAETVRTSFAKQGFMATLKAELLSVEPGRVEVGVENWPGLQQQHGFVHAGVTTTLLDNACGYAAISLKPPGIEVLTIELKVNLLNPGRGERMVAVGQVVKDGRQVTVVQADAYGIQADGSRIHVATMLASMMAFDLSRA
ncbi:PaaI family thioesterase [Sporichthya brevicatena]|uniref:PaaI family thioesterase n=1 Tax=Sporichthya brevicatena TaxID=171442 RepID=A0ABN1HB45_9ACTN